MLTVGSFEAKNQLAELLRKVQEGEEVLITKHGQPAARLVAPDQIPVSPSQVFSALRSLRENSLSKRKKGEPLSLYTHAGHRW